MATRVPHPDFDALFVMYNHLRRQLDAALGKQQLTLTSLLVLTAVEQGNERHREILSAAVVRSLGLTKGTVSVVVKQLEEKGWLAESEVDRCTRRGRALVLTKRGRQKMHAGLVVREDVLSEFTSFMNVRDRAALMRVAASIVAKIIEQECVAYSERYISSFKHHRTRALIRRQIAKAE